VAPSTSSRFASGTAGDSRKSAMLGLLGHTEQQDRRSVNRLTLRIEDVLCASCDVVWHARVNLLSQLHEPKRVAELDPNAVAEIVRIDRYSVTTNARTWGGRPGNRTASSRPDR
jgi:hypothetical protein